MTRGRFGSLNGGRQHRQGSRNDGPPPLRPLRCWPRTSPEDVEPVEDVDAVGASLVKGTPLIIIGSSNYNGK